MKIIDDFYSSENYATMFTIASHTSYSAMYQPEETHFYDRLKAYPCYQSSEFRPDDTPYKILVKTFEEKNKLKVLECSSVFRKILSSELETIFKYGVAPHIDNKKYDFAGVVYYNIESLYDGTAIYSSQSHREPNIIVGAKSNRCVFYNPLTWHSPLQDKNTITRLIQPFFIKIDS
jgi:hypothetical protein